MKIYAVVLLVLSLFASQLFAEGEETYPSLTKTIALRGLAPGFCATDDGFAVGVWEFAKQAPKRIVVGNNSINLELYSKDAVLRRFATGAAKTHYLVVSFDSQSEATQKLPAINKPLTMRCDPEYYAKCDVMEGLPAPSEKSAELDGLLRNEIDTVIKYYHNYGMVDFGDIGSKKMFWNSEIDKQKTVLLDYMRFGNPEYLWCGMNMSRHNMDIDNCHFYPEKVFQGHGTQYTYRWVGGQHGHSCDHNTATRFPYISHTWIQGYILDYYLTGNYRSLECAAQTGRSLVRASNNLGVQIENGSITGNSNSRSLGQTLINLSGLYETGYNPRYMRTMKMTARQIVLGQADDGAAPGAVNQAGKWGTGYAKGDQSPQKAARVLGGMRRYLQVNDDPEAFEYMVKLTEWIMAPGNAPFKLGTIYHNGYGMKGVQVGNASTYLVDALSFIAAKTQNRRYSDTAYNMLQTGLELPQLLVPRNNIGLGRDHLYYYARLRSFPAAPEGSYSKLKTVKFVQQSQNADGGFGLWKRLVSDMECTSRAVAALAALGEKVKNKRALLDWVQRCRDENNYSRNKEKTDVMPLGYAVEPAWSADVVYTDYAITLLNIMGVEIPAKDDLIEWLRESQNYRKGEKGGFGDSPRDKRFYGLVHVPYHNTWGSVGQHTYSALTALNKLGAKPISPVRVKAFLDLHKNKNGSAKVMVGTKGYRSPISGPLNAMLLVKGYRELDLPMDEEWVNAAIKYFKSCQNTNGGCSRQHGKDSSILYSGACYEGLKHLGAIPDDLDGLKEWILTCSKADGGFSNRPDFASDSLSTFYAVSILEDKEAK